jgi:hypothetical protein
MRVNEHSLIIAAKNFSKPKMVREVKASKNMAKTDQIVPSHFPLEPLFPTPILEIGASQHRREDEASG